MSGISPKLPLMLSAEHGAYGLNKTFKEATKQNFKNLLLTIPGEKVMDPNFGVGLIEMLFEQDPRFIQSELEARIQNQISLYLPHIILLGLEISNEGDIAEFGANSLGLKLKYRIIPLNDQDSLDITIE